MKTNKIDWDLYYLTQCFIISQRSIDQSKKCGSIIVSSDNRPLSQGYNGPIKNSNDIDFPITRPEKYGPTIHAEENAILAYNGSYQDIQGSTIYVTGKPCHRCMRMILQKGISRIVYPKFPIAKCQDEFDQKAFDQMLIRINRPVIVDELDVIQDVLGVLDISKAYINNQLSNL